MLQSCPTLCDPIDGSPPGSAVPGILQARILEWVAISFSNAWKRKVKVKSLSRVRLLATPWIAAYQAPPSMGFSRQEYWSGVPLPSWIGKIYFKKRLCRRALFCHCLVPWVKYFWSSARSNTSLYQVLFTGLYLFLCFFFFFFNLFLERIEQIILKLLS